MTQIIVKRNKSQGRWSAETPETRKLPACLRRYSKFIDSVSDERAYGEGYWVNLRDGWCNPADPSCHTLHEDTPQECAQYFPVEQCWCKDCRLGDKL